jgi:hypothetical protein
MGAIIPPATHIASICRHTRLMKTNSLHADETRRAEITELTIMRGLKLRTKRDYAALDHRVVLPISNLGTKVGPVMARRLVDL